MNSFRFPYHNLSQSERFPKISHLKSKNCFLKVFQLKITECFSKKIIDLYCCNPFESFLRMKSTRKTRRRGLVRRKNSIRYSTNQGQGRESNLLPPRAAALPRLDAGSGGVEPASSCVIQNLQIACSSWYMM